MSRLLKIADWSGEKRGNVVFVHGLGGIPTTLGAVLRMTTRFWPLWLAEDVRGLSVYSLGHFSPQQTGWEPRCRCSMRRPISSGFS